ncbi:Piso0_005681 [Millerozyma farinosa CBS 7064]|uniref:Piso0_005681 protein n=1 Tax=Pichia sorbitophila (strain ATCC MYA-4447 / BCRC 22081 / CBS 7064 / NBRC 10061 / NRRL Y-12695) TaxID=559304 RepID=G8XZN2_PICSO|nr:Piso0_005681 [Millerozyma farinosa CBS 7064]
MCKVLFLLGTKLRFTFILCSSYWFRILDLEKKKCRNLFYCKSKMQLFKAYFCALLALSVASAKRAYQQEEVADYDNFDFDSYDIDLNEIIPMSTNSNSSSEENQKEEPSPDKCSKDRYEIENLNDMKDLHDCKVVKGDIVVLNYKEPILQFGHINRIEGNLEIYNAPNLVRIEAEEVRHVGKAFILSELTSLSLISFPSLRFVKVLDWKVLPILNSVHFSNEIKDIESITVSDTSLIGFSGFMTSKLENLDINNNRFLETINCDVEKITGKLHIAANSKDVKVSLPKLEYAKNVSIHDVLDINLEKLSEIESSINVIENNFDTFKLPNLKSIGGTLSILQNDKLNSVKFPNLTEIGGGLMVVNNSNIDKVNFFPELNIIGGALEIVGNIKELDFDKLKLVKGSAKIKSSDAEFSCAAWTKSDMSSVIRGGKIECTNANNERIVSNTPTENGKKVTTTESGPVKMKVSSGGNKNSLNSIFYTFLAVIWSTVF